MKRILIAVSMIVLACRAAYAQPPAPAQDKDFSALILAAKTDAETAAVLEEAQGVILPEEQLSGIRGFSCRCGEEEKDCSPLAAYYTGAARYQQMKYLEETQNWDEYFSKGNDYRKEITDNLEKIGQGVPGNRSVYMCPAGLSCGSSIRTSRMCSPSRR